MSATQNATKKKRIYADKAIANMIAGKLAKHQGIEFSVQPVTTGFQVIPVTVVKAYMPPAKPLPVMKLSTKPVTASQTNEELVTLTFPFHSSSAKYVNAKKSHEDTKMHLSFGLTNVVKWWVVMESQEHSVLYVTLTKKFAQKRGLI